MTTDPENRRRRKQAVAGRAADCRSDLSSLQRHKLPELVAGWGGQGAEHPLLQGT